VGSGLFSSVNFLLVVAGAYINNGYWQDLIANFSLSIISGILLEKTSRKGLAVEIPKPNHPSLFADVNADQRKELTERLLTEMNEQVGEAIQTEPNFDAVRNRYRMSVYLVAISVIVGTVFLLVGSLTYSALPSPSVFVTTQDGRLIEKTPLPKE
jgi:hypothetical protein